MGKAVVTGHSGFIGTHLVSELKRKGFEVVCVNPPYTRIECDRVYHLACSSSTVDIENDVHTVMDVIFDLTRAALDICPTAHFINASTMGALGPFGHSTQSAYNLAKRCMELYVEHRNQQTTSYRIPATYGEGMQNDKFIKKCVDGTAYAPTDPDRRYYIAHVDDVVEALVTLRSIRTEPTTLGEIYEHFSSGRRRLHRPAPDA